MSFDAWARWYRGGEFVLAGGLMQRCRLHHLNQLHGIRRVLLLGEGPGRFLEVLCERHPSAEVTCVDASRGMLDQAARAIARRGGASSRVQWVHADVRGWKPETPGYDLIVTHFFLDCFTSEELADMIPRIASWSASDAGWLLADFRIPSAGWRRWRATGVHALMYFVFRKTTQLSARSLVDPTRYIAASGFHLESRAEFSAGLLHTELWQRRTSGNIG